MPAKVTAAGSSQPKRSWSPAATASAKNISLDRKPLNRGTPAIAAAATIASSAVYGMYFHMPLTRRMSRVPHSWSMMPAAMNSPALKMAWLIRWNTPATAASGVPTPNRATIRPR